jgi:hypothetical protein
MGFFTDNAYTILGSSVAGAALFAALEKMYQGNAGFGDRYVKAAAIGAICGGALSFSILKGRDIAEGIGSRNYALIGGAIGMSASLLYYLVNKNYNTKALIRNTAIVSATAGSAGAALVAYNSIQ